MDDEDSVFYFVFLVVNRRLFSDNLKNKVRDLKMSKNPKQLPFDMGREAYISRKTPDDNPYLESSWKNKEWWLGWSHEEESDSGSAWSWSKSAFDA